MYVLPFMRRPVVSGRVGHHRQRDVIQLHGD